MANFAPVSPGDGPAPVRMSTEKLANQNAQLAQTMAAYPAGLIGGMSCCMLVPAAAFLVVGFMNLSKPCDSKIAIWMIVQGCLLPLSYVILVCLVCCLIRQLSSQELQEAAIHADRDHDEEAQGEVAQAIGKGMACFAVSWCSLACLGLVETILFIVGWVFFFSADQCDQSVKTGYLAAVLGTYGWSLCATCGGVVCGLVAVSAKAASLDLDDDDEEEESE